MLRNASIQTYAAVGRINTYQSFSDNIISFPETRIANESIDSNDRQSASAGLRNNSIVVRPEEVNAANPGDHPLILRYLRSTSSEVSEPEFEHSLDHPEYDAKHRHIVRQRDEIIGHIRTIPQEVRYGSVMVPSAELTEFVTLPEYDDSDCRDILLSSATKHAATAERFLVTAKSSPESNSDEWTQIESGADCVVSPRDLLSAMETVFLQDGIPKDWQSQYEVRPWRWIERYQMMDIFNEVSSSRDGVPERSDEYWHWLASRHGYDRAYIVVDQSGQEEKIVGYTFLRNDKLLEFAVIDHDQLAVYNLLRRIALEAVEKGNHALTFKASCFFGNQTVLKVLRQADISLTRSSFSCRITSTIGLLRQLAPELNRLARAEGLSTGTKLALQCGDEALTIHILRNKVRISKGIDARSCVTLSKQQMTRMLFGDFDLLAEVATGSVQSSTQIAKAIAVKLFPKKKHFRLPLDHQRSLS